MSRVGAASSRAARRQPAGSRETPGIREPWAQAACAVLLVAGIALRAWHLPVMVYTPDEDAYVNFYAVPLLQQGLGHLPALVKDYNARPELHAFPSPTRVGQLWPMVATMLILRTTRRVPRRSRPPSAAWRS